MTINQISVFLENKPGQLAEFTRLLEENQIDMRALSIAETQDFGILRLIVDDPYKTVNVVKDAGISVRSRRCWRSNSLTSQAAL